MRVLFWSELFWPSIGGAEIFASKLLLALVERNHEFVVVTGQPSPDLAMLDQYKGIPVYRFPFWAALTSRKADQLMAIRRQVTNLGRAFAADLVHLHCFGPSVFFLLETMRACPAPLLVTLTEERQELAVACDSLSRTLRLGDWITGKAGTVIGQARELVPEIAARSSVIRNGLDVPSLVPEPLSVEDGRLLCLGRLTRQKGFDLALKAFATIIDRFPRVRLVIAGDGPERENLERQIKKLGLRDRVGLIGWVAPGNVPELMNTVMAVIMPSRWEGLPSVALQAGIMARPIVATRVGGLPEVIVHEETGMLVDSEDVRGLVDAIYFLLEHPHAAMQMGRAARSRVQEVFGWEQCVGAYEALYRRLGSQGLDTHAT